MAPRLALFLSSLPAVLGVRSLVHNLGGLPCELKLKIVHVDDKEGGKEDAVQAESICSEALQEVTLVVPRWDTGMAHDLKFGDLEKGRTTLGSARPVAGPYLGETMMGATYILKGSSHGVAGEVSATVTEDLERSGSAPAAYGDAPCSLEKKTVTLEDHSEGFNLIVTCTEDVDFPKLHIPGFRAKTFAELKKGTKAKIAGPFPTAQFAGKDFTLEGSSDGKEFSTKVTIVTEDVERSGSAPAAHGDAPCSLEKKTVTLQDDSEGFKLMVTCTEDLDSPKLHIPGFKAKTFAKLNKGTDAQIDGPYRTAQFAGKDFTLEGSSDGKEFSTKVTI